MTETVRGLDFDTGELVEVKVQPALPSAKLFKELSDRLWEYNTDPESSYVRIPVDFPADKAKDMIEEVAEDIDSKLAVGNLDSGIKIAGESQHIFEALFSFPTKTVFEAYNWDGRNNWRYTDESRKNAIWLADGKLDYAREIALILKFAKDGRRTELNYSIQRYETYQDGLVSINMSYWDPSQATTGYEGTNVYDAPMTLEQEMRILQTFQKIGKSILNPPL